MPEIPHTSSPDVNPLVAFCSNLRDGITAFVGDTQTHPHALVRGVAVGAAVGLGVASVLNPVGALVVGGAIAKWVYNLNRDDEELDTLKDTLHPGTNIAIKQFETTMLHLAPAGYTLISNVMAMDPTDHTVLPDPVPALMTLYYAAKTVYEPVAEHSRVLDLNKVENALRERDAETKRMRDYCAKHGL